MSHMYYFLLKMSLKQGEDINDFCLLRKMLDLVEIQIRNLENLGNEASGYGAF